MVALHGGRVGGENTRRMATNYSNIAPFHVAEEVMFERDRYSGIITRDQAVELVREFAGCPADEEAQPVLMPIEETGLCVWWVFVGGTDCSSGSARGFEVNPYTGKVAALETRDTQKEEVDS
jgi:hypothetical protein